MSKRDFYIKESEMDDFQRRIINRRSDSSLIVRGCAGSGKSIVALWKLHDVVANNKGSAQLIVFTKALKDYFTEGCRELKLDPSLIDYWHHWKSSPTTKDYIFVDEAQDFTLAEIRKMQSYSKNLLLYGDSSQQLYSWKHDSVTMEELQQETNFPLEQLVFNYRLPRQIARVAQYVNEEGDDLEGRCKEEGSEKPYILRYPSFNSQLSAIKEIVETRELEDVGILLPDNETVRQAADCLQASGLSVESKSRETNSLNFATSNPKIMTYHSAKGLQFETVFLPGCESSALDRGDGFDEPLYVAMTRSYQYLYIMYSQYLPDALDEVPSTLYSTTLKRETELL